MTTLLPLTPIQRRGALVAFALACGALPLASQAGPSQGSVDPPGGFASACASQVSAGVTYTPGLDITGFLNAYPGQASCQSQVFAGGSGQATAAASWTAPELHNESAVAAQMGRVGFAAQNTSPGGYTYQFPVGVAAGGWSDSLLIDLPGHSGEAAIWRFTMQVGGSLATSGTGLTSVLLNAYKNKQELMNNVPGFDRGGSDVFGTDRQRVGWSASRGADREILDVVTFAVPVTLGESFIWGVYATVKASVASYGPSPTIAVSEADFAHTLEYGSSAGLYLGDMAMDGFTITSASGIDWLAATPVPEPGRGLLAALGLAVIALRLHRCGLSDRVPA